MKSSTKSNICLIQRARLVASRVNMWPLKSACASVSVNNLQGKCMKKPAWVELRWNASQNFFNETSSILLNRFSKANAVLSTFYKFKSASQIGWRSLDNGCRKMPSRFISGPEECHTLPMRHPAKRKLHQRDSNHEVCKKVPHANATVFRHRVKWQPLYEIVRGRGWGIV